MDIKKHNTGDKKVIREHVSVMNITSKNKVNGHKRHQRKERL